MCEVMVTSYFVMYCVGILIGGITLLKILDKRNKQK